MLDALSFMDIVALTLFVSTWLAIEFLLEHTRLRERSLSGLMSEQRRAWMRVLAARPFRMVDTQIISGLQQGAAFFTSTSILAIGGCFALLGSTDTVLQIYRDLPMPTEVSRVVWEIKVLGLTCVLVFAFFKFGWSLRLFNYCGILIGAVPEQDGSSREQCLAAANRAAEINIIAARHFNAGMRSMFFGLGFLGWFVGPIVLILTTVFVVLVLLRRQFFSRARKMLLEDVRGEMN